MTKLFILIVLLQSYLIGNSGTQSAFKKLTGHSATSAQWDLEGTGALGHLTQSGT